MTASGVMRGEAPPHYLLRSNPETKGNNMNQNQNQTVEVVLGVEYNVWGNPDNQFWCGWKVFVGDHQYSWHQFEDDAYHTAQTIRDEMVTGNDPFGTYCYTCQLKTAWEWDPQNDWDGDGDYGNYGTCTVCQTVYASTCGVDGCCPWEPVEET